MPMASCKSGIGLYFEFAQTACSDLVALHRTGKIRQLFFSPKVK